jgi:hypothetical protein
MIPPPGRWLGARPTQSSGKIYLYILNFKNIILKILNLYLQILIYNLLF